MMYVKPVPEMPPCTARQNSVFRNKIVHLAINAWPCTFHIIDIVFVSQQLLRTYKIVIFSTESDSQSLFDLDGDRSQDQISVNEQKSVGIGLCTLVAELFINLDLACDREVSDRDVMKTTRTSAVSYHQIKIYVIQIEKTQKQYTSG